VACVGGLDTRTCADELWLECVMSPADSKLLNLQVHECRKTRGRVGQENEYVVTV
jgi:hypothetical protein